MGNDEILTDDYVAELLAKDANDSAIRYSSMGLDAFKQSKMPSNKPKPNTRFLQNIIKNTDSHNAALRAKETAESRARLESLGSNERREEKASRVGGGDIRRRQLGDIAAILGGRPRKRAKVGEGGRRVNTSSEDEEPEERARAASHRIRDIRESREERRRSNGQRGHHRRHRSASRERGKDGEDRRRRRRSRSGSPREHRSKESRHRERSPRRKRSRSPDADKARGKSHRSSRGEVDSGMKEQDREKNLKEAEAEAEAKANANANAKDGYYSDPLDDIIGPRPPPIPKVRTKGRGTISQASGIDARFSANYDPSTDVRLDSDEDDPWDQALEAMRARKKFREIGADRLRAAGFTEDEVKRWENGGDKREEDVRWAKKGEGREWDRGKVLDEEGKVSVEPQFGRLKDT